MATMMRSQSPTADVQGGSATPTRTGGVQQILAAPHLSPRHRKLLSRRSLRDDKHGVARDEVCERRQQLLAPPGLRTKWRLHCSDSRSNLSKKILPTNLSWEHASAIHALPQLTAARRAFVLRGGRNLRSRQRNIQPKRPLAEGGRARRLQR